jgi:phage gpG-like protein
MILEFKIEGVEELGRKLNKFSNNIKDWSQSTKKVGQYLQGFFTNDVFESEGGVFGEKWVLGKYYHKLQRTGFMRNSFYFKNDKNQVEVGNKASYFKYHQSNQPRKSHLPRRIMFKLDEMRRRKVVRFFQEQIIVYKRANNL